MTELIIGPDHLKQLVAIESHVNYGEPPPPGVDLPFVVLQRDSPVLLSAPHGARSFRQNDQETWHEEDEYTAGMALLLSELCQTSVIATIWCSDHSDPNWHHEADSAYKRALRQLVQENGIRWLIDLHGMREARLKPQQRVDLGTRKELHSLPAEQLDLLVHLIEARLGTGSVHHNFFSARQPDRTLTAFCHGRLGIHAVQIEMKTSVRVPFRRTDASKYASDGPYAAVPEDLIGMMQALVDIVAALHNLA